jgi:uncharacterized protein DUF3226
MKVYLLVEGKSDLDLFRRLLPSEILPDTTIVTAGGRSNITSKASSLMVTKRRPLALVTDADTIEKDAVEQRLQSLQELVRSATAGVPYKIILAVPEIESWFFVVPEVLERLSGKKLSPEQQELGEMRPKEVLAQIFKNQEPWSVARLASELTELEVQTLRETQPRKELIAFLTEQANKKIEQQPA